MLVRRSELQFTLLALTQEGNGVKGSEPGLRVEARAFRLAKKGRKNRGLSPGPSPLTFRVPHPRFVRVGHLQHARIRDSANAV